MYLKLNEKTVRVPVLNGEPIVLKLDKPSVSHSTKTVIIEGVPTDTTIKELSVQFSAYTLDNLDAKAKLIINGFYDIQRFIIPDEALVSYLLAAKELKAKLRVDFPSILDSDVSIMSELEWRHSDRPIRFYIPAKHIVNVPMYSEYVATIKAENTPYYEVEDGYILYLSEIYPAFQSAVEADPNVLIETL